MSAGSVGRSSAKTRPAEHNPWTEAGYQLYETKDGLHLVVFPGGTGTLFDPRVELLYIDQEGASE